MTSFAFGKRKGGCGSFKLLFALFQFLLLLLLFQFTFIEDQYSPLTQLPTFADVRQQYLDSIGAFSTIQISDRQISSAGYLTSPILSEREKSFLRHFIHDYIGFHKHNRRNATRRLIFMPFRTGIGDRMGCLMFAYWAAVVSQRLFLIDWQKPFPLRDFMTEANDLDILLTDNQIQEETIGNVSRLNNTESSQKMYGEVFASDTNTVIMETNKYPSSFSESLVSRFLPNHLTAKQVIAMRENRHFQRIILHQVLSLSDRMKGDQDALNSQMGLTGNHQKMRKRSNVGPGWLLQPFTLPGKPYIAVHARIGMGVGESDGRRFRDISRNLSTAAICLASRAVRLAFLAGGPALPIYFATDTPSFRSVFEEKVLSYSDGRVEVMSGNWSVQHSNKMTANVGKPYRGREWEAMWGSYMDLVMLGHGTHIVALYSSFARLAMALGNAEVLTEIRNHVCLS